MSETLTRRSEIPPAYRVHPLLDPRLPSHHPAVTRIWARTCRQILREPDAYEQMVASYAHPLGSRQLTLHAIDAYFHDADAYLDDLLRLVPEEMAGHLRPLAETRLLAEMRDLFRVTFEGHDPRARYEAQRKLYLAKLLFDIDHCRSVRDGLRHQERFERLLTETLWKDTQETGEVEVCCRLRRRPDGSEHLEVGVAPSDGASCWRFRVRRLRASRAERPIDVYHYRSRFKRETNPAPPALDEQGMLLLTEEVRWPRLGGRSGSILSKMIRRGIPEPGMVQDVLGAMFIVGDTRQAFALERRLIRDLGGPLRWRDRVDTLSGQRDRALLDTRSSAGFTVLKSLVDILVEDPAALSPYLFAVEVQIYPVEAYARTLHDAHFASHFAYKRRQFLHDLLPLLFPPEIYGEEVLLLGGTVR